jgi:hypothetical protein
MMQFIQQNDNLMTLKLVLQAVCKYFCRDNSTSNSRCSDTTKQIYRTSLSRGINYKKTDANLRGQLAINPEQYANLLSLAPAYGVKEFFVLSTCNRTEIYGFADHSISLSNLLCTQTRGELVTF